MSIYEFLSDILSIQSFLFLSALPEASVAVTGQVGIENILG
jgi:hypothetical protein